MSFRKIKDWNGKTVIVTGAGTGVGKALCHDMAARGAIVYVTTRSIQRSQLVADEILAKGHTAFAAQIEVGNFEEFKRVIEQVKEKHGKLDVLINNAAIVYVGEYYDMEEDYIKQLVHVNLTSILIGTLYAYRIMKEQGFGSIINVTSMAGYLPTAMMVAYSASKHGLIGLTRSLAAEATEFGIGIKVMCLGLVESEMLNKAKVKHGDDGNVVYETVPIKPMATGKAAKILVDGLRKKKMFIFVPWYAKFYFYIQRYIPGMVFKGAVHTMKKYREIMANK